MMTSHSNFYMTYEEVAAEIGIPRTSVIRAEKTGLKKLKKEIERRGIDVDDLMMFDKVDHLWDQNE